MSQYISSLAFNTKSVPEMEHSSNEQNFLNPFPIALQPNGVNYFCVKNYFSLRNGIRMC